jgi:hypothetical protein
MNGEENKLEKSLAERGVEAASKAASGAGTKAVERGIESFVPAPFRDSARGLIDRFTKAEEPKPAVVAEGASAAGKTENPLDRAFAEGKRLGERGKELLRDGEKAVQGFIAPAAPAASAPADGKKEPTLGERAEQALKYVTGGVGKAAEGVKSDVVNTLEEAQKAGGKLVDGVAAALKPVEPAAVAPVNSAPNTALLASDAQAKASESAPDLVASASASKKSEFNPRFNKPDGKGEVVITKKDGGGVSIQTSTESVYERALKAMKANDTAAGKEPQKYEALSAAAEVAAQATPKANPTGSKGHAK